MREARPHTDGCRRRIGEAMMGDEMDRRKKEEDEEQMNWRTFEKELEEVSIEQEPQEDCRVSERLMDQQEEGPEKKRVQVSVKDALAQWGQRRRSAGREKGGPQETKEVQGEKKRPRENAPEGELAELPMNLSLIQQLQCEAQKFGQKTSEAMDILTEWDFSKDEHKRMAKECIHKYKPRLIVGQPDVRPPELDTVDRGKAAQMA